MQWVHFTYIMLLPFRKDRRILDYSVSCGLAPLVLLPLKYQSKITTKFTLSTTIIHLEDCIRFGKNSSTAT